MSKIHSMAVYSLGGNYGVSYATAVNKRNSNLSSTTPIVFVSTATILLERSSKGWCMVLMLLQKYS